MTSLEHCPRCGVSSRLERFIHPETEATEWVCIMCARISNFKLSRIAKQIMREGKTDMRQNGRPKAHKRPNRRRYSWL